MKRDSPIETARACCLPGSSSLPLWVLAVLAGMYTVHFAKPVLLPLVIGVMFAVLLNPVVAALEGRLRVPRPLGAGVVLLLVVATLGYGAYRLSGPASRWVAELPRHLPEVEAKVRGLTQSVEEVGRATEEVARIARVADDAETPKVEIREASVGQTLVTQAGDLVAGGAVLVALMYFLLASGDLFLRKLARAMPTFRARRRAVEAVRQVQRDVSRYLLTLSIINVGLGFAVAVSIRALGLPNPILWGVMAGVLNFIPYLGPMVGVSIVALVSFMTFDSVGQALAPPLAYAFFNAIEGSLVTPSVLGLRLRLNPAAIFVGLLFWGWIWGIPGALLAVPILVTLKIIGDHFEPLQPALQFLAR